MEVINPNGVKVYNLSTGKSFPKFLTPAQKRKLAKDEEYRRRIELIQEFEFNQSCQKIKVSQDGNYIMTSGVYPPMVKCYDTQQMSEKFRRHLECDIVQFQFLSDDFSKFAFLLADRTLEFHARYGFHYRTRIPKFGRDITYHKERCELFACGSSNEIYRLDLEQGTFMAPIEAHCKELNKIVLAPVHQMLVVGNIQGEIECYDSRSRNCLQCVKIFDNETCDLRFSNDGMNLAVGSQTGEVKIFDIRTNKPFFTFEHAYETPITSMKYNGDFLLTSDRKTVKINNIKTQKTLCNIEPEAPINHMNVVKDTGLLFIAAEQPKIMSYFIPSLGTAPRWCSFLDNLAEEMEEETTGVYDDFKFVTKQELAELNLENLIGTDMLKAYMHGFFIDTKLYERSKAIAKPTMYEDYQKEKNRKKDKERKERRITMNKKKPAVNAELAEKWEQEGKKDVDDRFAALFKNEDFEIDRNSEDFKRNHGGISGRVQIEDDEDDEDDDANEEELFEEDFDLLNAHDNENNRDYHKNSSYGSNGSNGSNDSDDDDFDDFDDDRKNDVVDDDEGYLSKKGRKEKEERDRIKPKVKFYGIKENNKISLSASKDELKKEVEKRKEKRTMSLGQRAMAMEQGRGRGRGRGRGKRN